MLIEPPLIWLSTFLSLSLSLSLPLCEVWEKPERDHEWVDRCESPKGQNQWDMDTCSRARDRTTSASSSWLPRNLVFMAPPNQLLGQSWLSCGCTWLERLWWLWLTSQSQLILCDTSCGWPHRPTWPFWWTTGINYHIYYMYSCMKICMLI